MRLQCLVLVAAVLVSWAAWPASANHEAEVWRSPFGTVRSVSANPTDGSCWAAVGSWVIHYAEDGVMLSKTNLWYPHSASVNPTDGSCWVADQGHSGSNMWSGPSQVVHLAADGTDLSRSSGFERPAAVAANPADGSCWVGELGPYDLVTGAYAGTVVHLAADGTEIWRAPGGAFTAPYSIGVNLADGSCWVSDLDETGTYLIHLAADGEELWRSDQISSLGSPPLQLAVNASDGSVWVALSPGLLHLAADGTQLGAFAEGAYAVSVNPADGSVWAACEDQVRFDFLSHLAADGTELWWGEGPISASWHTLERVTVNPSVNPSDGSVWSAGQYYDPTAGTRGLTLAHHGADGAVVWREQVEMDSPRFPAVIPGDGGVWYADVGNGKAVRLGPDGAELLRSAGGYGIGSFDWSVPALQSGQNEGSCWLIDQGDTGSVAYDGSRLVRLGTDGDELAQTPPLPDKCRIDALAVDPRDGSVWMTYATFSGSPPDEVATLDHYNSEGKLLWTHTYGRPTGWQWAVAPSVSLSPLDGSVWLSVLSPTYTGLIHLDRNGQELWRGGKMDWWSDGHAALLAANPRDGSCWALYELSEVGVVAQLGGTELVCFNADGSERWRLSDIRVASMAFDPVTDLCWAVSDMEIVILDRNGKELWRTGGFGPWPQGLSVNVVDGACWVTDSLNDQIVKLLLPGPFRDVPFFNWAADAIAACVAAGIVGGYPDGWYHPDLTVTRDQMAVFISRALAGGEAGVPPGPDSATFSDVPTGYWAFKYVEYAKSQGVVGGYSNGTYRPTLPVTRDQMAVFVARAMAGGDSGVPTGPSTATFPDVPMDYWAFKYVECAKANSVVGGYPDGNYHPEITVTRDQMAVFVQRAFALPL